MDAEGGDVYRVFFSIVGPENACDPLYYIDHGHDLPIIKTFELNGAAPA